jgi:hypothetical protein
MFMFLKYLFLIILFCDSLQDGNYSYSELLKECGPGQTDAQGPIGHFYCTQFGVKRKESWKLRYL